MFLALLDFILAVPIFNIDKRPFAVLCAYSTGERTTPFVSFKIQKIKLFGDPIGRSHFLKSRCQLEGHELSYLRAIGKFRS